MKIKNILQEAYLALDKDFIQNPHLEAELLLSRAIAKPREFILANPKQTITQDELSIFNTFIEKRLKEYPLAYIINEKSFYSLDFYVDENVLIPRPETEILVDKAIEIIKNENIDTLVDIGTGSGCIPIAIKKNIPKLNIFAIDISEKAIEVAKKNAKKNNVEIKFIKNNLLEKNKFLIIPTLFSKIKAGSRQGGYNSSLLITANLPYLTKEQIKSSRSIQKEPTLALDGGDNGMEYYQKLFEQIKNIKKEMEEIKIFLLAEIDHTQVEIFKEDCLRILNQAEIDVIKDYQGYERVVKVNL